jgi:hypothetical protein
LTVALGSLVANGLGGRGGVALFALTTIHQLTALGRVGLRASWLAEATRALGDEVDDDDVIELEPDPESDPAPSTREPAL